MALSPVEDTAMKILIDMIVDESKGPPVTPPLVKGDVQVILARIKPVFEKQPMLLEIQAPVSICGDVHGQLVDVVRLFNKNGWPPKTRYLFLGGYIDRGPQSAEVIMLLFLLKIRFPGDIFLLRGNHETRAINRVYGFLAEMKKHYDDGGKGPQGEHLWKQFNDAFAYMPLAALVADRILCVHGGISPKLTHFQQIRKLKRPILQIPDNGLETDLLWANPNSSVRGFAPGFYGISYWFGADAVIQKCRDLNLDMIVRAHQVVYEGFEFFADGHLLTLFTAPDYCEQFMNSGGVLRVEADLTCRMMVLPSKFWVQ